MAESIATTVLKGNVIRETVEALGLRSKKLRRKISWEEIEERWWKGICMFCDEPETPDHHLRHKNSGILMIDCEEDQSPNGKELVKIEVATESIEIEHRTIDREANADMILAISEEGLIPQFQVSDSNSEILSNIKLREEKSVLEDLVVMNENLEQEWDQNNVTKRFEVEGDVERGREVLSITEICCAHQVFGKMSTHEEKLGIKKTVKGFKSWMFKYKSAKGKIKKQDNQGWVNTWSRKVSWKKNKFFKTWSMLNVDCLKDDDQVYHESLLIGLLIRFKFWKFKFINRILQKIRPQIEEDRMDDDHKQQQGDNEPLATAPDFVIKFINMNLQKKTGEHGYVTHGKLMSDQERHDEILRSAPYANLGTESFMETDSLSDQSQLIEEHARNHSTDSILKLSLLQPKDSFLKHQVSIYHWKFSQRSPIESLDVYEDLSPLVRSQLDFKCAASNALQVFHSIPVRTKLLQNLRKKRLSKTWWFKFKELDVMQEDVQHVLLAFLQRSATKTRYDIGEHDEMFKVSMTVSVRCMLGLKCGVTVSDAGHGEKDVYDRIIMVKEQLSHNSLVIQEVIRNKKIKFSKRWWFKYKSVEEGFKRLSSKLCTTYYFAVWHCWKRKTLPHISFFALQYFQRIDTIMI